MNEAFGKVCAHFAVTFTTCFALALSMLFAPWIVYTVLIVIGLGMGMIGLQVWYELTRINRVKGKGLREVQ